VKGIFCIFTISIMVLTSMPAFSQAIPADSLVQFLAFEEHDPLSCLITYLPPVFIQNGLEMKSFIRGRTFRRLREAVGDVRAMDAVYIRAMQLTNNNTAIALLLSAIACFDHRLVGFKVPLFQLYFPLSNESESEFLRRVANLPSKVYTDTPREGDRDKPQHFFGSALMAFLFESAGAADRTGDFIEEGEDAFIIGGINDERDKRSNRQGRQFGLALLDNNRRLPSEFLRFEIAVEPEPVPLFQEDPRCDGGEGGW
jgi:hypothetical protein